MSGLFDGLLKPGQGVELSFRRELERRRASWDRPGYLYRGAGDYLLQHGRFYSGRVIPDRFEQFRGPGGHCFDNACLAAQACPELRYVEGVYSTGNAHPMPHAWCIDPDGGVVELTAPTTNLERYHNEKGLPFISPERWGYWGVIFQPELSAWHAEVLGEYCMFDRDATDISYSLGLGLGESFTRQDHDFPILKVPYDPARTTL